MKKLYIVFDKIPSKTSGGLVATYIRLVELLKKDFKIEIISIFDASDEDKEQFKNNKINVLSNYDIDIRFYKFFKYLKRKEFLKFLKGLLSAFYYFLYIPIARYKIKKLIGKDDKVIVSSPSAAIFMSSKVKFILEIHTNYEYFFGNNKLGKMQTSLMAKPNLILFRSKIDAKKASAKFPASYIYNFFDNSVIDKNYDLNDNQNKIIFIGRLEKEKNPLRMLEVAKQLKGYVNDFEIDIYGTGSMKECVQKEIISLGLEKNVIFKGFTTNKSIYQNYSLLLLTSNVEGFPLTIIEAKANGIPTVTSVWGDAVYETVTNGSDGYIADTNEEIVKYILKIFNNDNLRKNLGKGALKDFDKYSPKCARARWIEILKN